ncbi:peroxiredoxin family protein [Nocardia sp. NPDC127526]|uniref:peroxiredoxin family protein n=1 Tax=Nocardia sp. NPDC127526 TaxID=3345393 RepID=UPI003624D711
MLTSGSRAPKMELEDTSGRPWRLSDHRGTDSVLLYFMRSTSCPMCNRHVRDLAAHRNEFEDKNIRVFVAIPEDRATGSAWKSRHDIPFPVLVGTSGTPHDSIGLTRKVFGSMQQSGTVLVDPNGVIRHAHGATLPTSSYDRKGILAAIGALPGRTSA